MTESGDAFPMLQRCFERQWKGLSSWCRDAPPVGGRYYRPYAYPQAVLLWGVRGPYGLPLVLLSVKEDLCDFRDDVPEADQSSTRSVPTGAPDPLGPAPRA